ncbi:hypothetical protein K0L59_004512 [Salmonella enterica]|uniref:Uncharacterized protein n=1 Tax=Salmonella enterica TaxID=28901 RepID=A0A750QTI4_SALER|nr:MULTISPECIES: hypothetical protein [Salmonella]EAA4133797.1 hypothetical protein [Salmonella enterica subsp. enterica serovar Newport]EAB6529534.1 hypothetical protein [Salmonella enterica subsp. enterica serovar Indiana]EAN1280201.1 hypothetical protein [Salmonella enterica]EBU8415672.1 hypothetical protein [Salmonella enterica subsp. enterica serovar Typhimurium]ECA5769948.1 hypothetical protein [Salmonella enterica subsp. enterica serovar Altona]ECH8719871.1 hypothetical protein [Salmon
MKEVKIYTIVSDLLSPPITGESFCTDMVRHSDYAELEAKCVALAAECESKKSALAAILEHCPVNDPDIDKAVVAMIAYDNLYCEKTPATDAFLAEVRASAIPEGYALVPQQIFLEPSDIELICSQCGDGHESGYGDFTDGLLWVGNIQRDDGSIVHGLHISSADYTEEGGVTVCEFAAQPRKGGAV